MFIYVIDIIDTSLHVVSLSRCLILLGVYNYVDNFFKKCCKKWLKVGKNALILQTEKSKMQWIIQ